MIPVLAFLQNSQVDFFVEQERKKNKILGVNASGKNLSFADNRILAQFSAPASTVNEALQFVEKLHQEKASILDAIKLSDLYELVQEENEAFSVDDLAALQFNELTPLKRLSLYELLLQDKVYFRQKNETFQPKKPEEVTAIQEQLSQEAQKKDEKAQLGHHSIDWLKEHLNAPPQELPEYLLSYLNPVRQLCIHGDDYPKKGLALEIMEEIKHATGWDISGNPHFAAFKLLKQIGVFHEDENLLLKRHNIPLTFGPDALAEAEKLIKNTCFSPDNRQDLREMYTLSIDDSQTKDIDDALSVIPREKGVSLLVHIADVAELIESETLLDTLARERTSSVYLPEETIPMFPPVLSEDLFSLLEDKPRYALTYQFDFDEQWQIESRKVFPSLIQVDKNYAYKEVDGILTDTTHADYPLFSRLLDFANAFQDKRLNHWNGLEFAFPAVNPKVDKDKITLKVFDPLHSESNLIIKELMILVNHYSANFCEDNSLPAIYIAQEAPDQYLDLPSRIITDKVLLQDFVKFMKKSYFSTIARSHFALGLNCYTQSTSPIRRYLDLVIQRQIKSFLAHKKSAYPEETLQAIRSGIELTKPVLSQIENETNKYWLLKYLLKSYRNKPLTAAVNKELPDGYVVELELTATTAKLITNKEIPLGSKIPVKLHTIIPRLGVSLGNY